MGVLHNELPSSTLGRAIRAVLGVKEGEKTIERFGETLTPVLDLWSLPEFSKLRDEWLCIGYATVGAGGAGFMSELSLRNPANSGKIAIIDGFSATGAGVYVRTKIAAATDLGTAQNTTAFRDLRVAIASATLQPICKLSSKNGDAATHGFACGSFFATTGTQMSPIRVPFVLPPNSSLIFDPSTTNQALTVTVFWRERRALAGELD